MRLQEVGFDFSRCVCVSCEPIRAVKLKITDKVVCIQIVKYLENQYSKKSVNLHTAWKIKCWLNSKSNIPVFKTFELFCPWSMAQ